jgi:hypothetical protein
LDFIIMDWWTGSACHILKQYCSKQRGYGWIRKHRIKKAPKLLLPYLNLFLYTSLSTIAFMKWSVENGSVTRATGTIEAAGFHTLTG